MINKARLIGRLISRLSLEMPKILKSKEKEELSTICYRPT